MNTGFVFLAGPYRARDGTHDWSAYCEIDANINRARQWAARLAQEGIPFFCPHLNSAHFEVITPEVKPEFWYNLDLRILQHATAVLLLPGWAESAGAQSERVRARILGIPVYNFEPGGDLGFNALVRNWKKTDGHS